MDNQTPAKPAASDGLSVYLETFGCQMNVLDTQLVRGQLMALGYRFIDDWQAADVVLYNTCSVREQAENKVYSRIGEVGLLKRDRPEIILGIIGCMAERDGLDMVRKHPQVDLLCGPGELDKVPMLIDNVVKTNWEKRGGVRMAQSALQGNTHRRSSTLAAAEDQLEMLDLSRSFSPEEFHGSAYVRITRGCNKFCTYCVVPNTRGAEVHRPPDHIIEECRKLVDAGVVEITLLGQTVNHYHYDHAAAVVVNGVQQPQIGSVVSQGAGRGHASTVGAADVTSFARLLARIHDEIPTLERLRFVTNFPRDFGDDILQVMAERPRICRYIHLPVQSGSDRILKLMNRGYTVAEYRELLKRVRRYLPDVQLATDIICGFPTETEEDHRATAELLRFGRFKNAFIFKYSPRPGTAAIDRFDDDVPDEIKKLRNNELLSIQSQISAEVHRECVGQTVRVFVESVSEKEKRARDAGHGASVLLGWEQPATQLTGRTDGDLIVCFEGDDSLVGSIVEVRIERAAALTLFGTLCNKTAEV
ncbi:MAG: MiaB/RimO family radical SAM methylthiotransferase [Phycisphaeraceae bacterium]|nr:MiaB/RimO family radical SAM methylthiotransferase [Phycisphaeraceae bacterium]